MPRPSRTSRTTSDHPLGGRNREDESAIAALKQSSEARARRSRKQKSRPRRRRRSTGPPGLRPCAYYTKVLFLPERPGRSGTDLPVLPQVVHDLFVKSIRDSDKGDGTLRRDSSARRAFYVRALHERAAACSRKTSSSSRSCSRCGSVRAVGSTRRSGTADGRRRPRNPTRILPRTGSATSSGAKSAGRRPSTMAASARTPRATCGSGRPLRRR